MQKSCVQVKVNRTRNTIFKISKKYEGKPPPIPVHPRKAISKGYPKRYKMPPPPPLGNNNFSEIGRHYPVGRVRGNLAFLTPPRQTPIYIYIHIYIYIYIYIYTYIYSHSHSHNHLSCRLLELPGISHRRVVPALLDPVGPRAA